MSSSALQNKHNNLVASIRSLQEQEKSLYERIKQINTSTNPQSHNDEKKTIIKNLQSIQDIRMKLYENLKLLYNENEADFEASTYNADSGNRMVEIVNNEIDEMKHELGSLKIQKQNQDKIAQVKQYRKKQTEHIYQVLKFVTYCFLGIIVVMFLRTLFLPATIARFAYIGILSFCMIKVILELYDMSVRDNFYYDRYTWATNKTNLAFDPNASNEENLNLNGSNGSKCKSGNR